MKSLKEAVLQGRKVLIRVDYNVPMKDGVVVDARKIEATLPTLDYILAQKPCRVVIMSHLGRPNGAYDKKYSLYPVFQKLQSLLEKEKVLFSDNCMGAKTKELIQQAAGGEVVLLENLRFYREETFDLEKKDAEKDEKEKTIQFRQTLTEYGDLFVSDAFGCLHRAHSSVVGIGLEERYAGFLVEEELTNIQKICNGPGGIDLVIVGGAKVKDKILLIENLCKKTRNMIVCGGMAYTFMKVTLGMKIGESIFDKEGAAKVPAILEEAKRNNVNVVFPVDFVVAREMAEEAETRTVGVGEGIPAGWCGFDCGPDSRKMFRELILRSRTTFWNGPSGVFEMKVFEEGTKAIVASLVEATREGSVTVAGGGETASCVGRWSGEGALTHVSTGGGATLELLEGKKLPGIEYLDGAS